MHYRNLQDRLDTVEREVLDKQAALKADPTIANQIVYYGALNYGAAAYQMALHAVPQPTTLDDVAWRSTWIERAIFMIQEGKEMCAVLTNEE